MLEIWKEKPFEAIWLGHLAWEMLSLLYFASIKALLIWFVCGKASLERLQEVLLQNWVWDIADRPISILKKDVTEKIVGFAKIIFLNHDFCQGGQQCGI